jgi:acetolactate synthase-1/2/3 large subunit
MTMRTGGEILADQLLIHGADTYFGVPGESYLALLDALHDRQNRCRFISCRHEGGAANMAEAWGKLTGRPGICMVTRGPGACHASIGVHTAFQDSTPMILLIGQIERGMRDREAFQEVDYRAFFGPLAKWATEIESADRIPEYMARAFSVAMSGRPGPVVLSLPEDMLTDLVDVPDSAPVSPGVPSPAAADISRFETLLRQAGRPLVMVGGGGWTAAAREDLMRFSAAWQVPVCAGFRSQDIHDNLSPSYAGHLGIAPDPKLAQRAKDCDLFIVLGARFDEMTTQGYTLPPAPRAPQALIHAHPGPEELNRVYCADLAICSAMEPLAAALAALAPPDSPAWAAETRQAHADYLAALAPIPNAGPLQMGEVMKILAETAPADSIITNGAGNYTGWVHRHWRYRSWRGQLAPGSGAMGYGVPAGISAKLRHPERMVISFAGDGCFLMSGQELATAAQYGANVIFIVVDNGLYGTIRMHQERRYPGRVLGTELSNPDFAAFAQSFGLDSERVERTEDFAGAFARARDSGKPALLHLLLDPEAISVRAGLSSLAPKT